VGRWVSYEWRGLLDTGLVDKAFFSWRPIFGDYGVPFAAGLNRSIEFTNSRFHQFGEDCASKDYFKDLL